ncbi:MAG: hypothetical protein JWO40_875 [Candidatus Doudnabacteria bacterium]|nr:hypothetical protein [Candidatus Doudnabacteria bacterium]
MKKTPLILCMIFLSAVGCQSVPQLLPENKIITPTPTVLDQTPIGQPTTLEQSKLAPIVETKPIADKPNTEIYVLEEQTTNDILTPVQGKDYWNVDVNKFVNQFYRSHDDKYDFLMVFPLDMLPAYTSNVINREVKGIGIDSVFSNNATKNLKAVVLSDSYRIWYGTKPNPPNFDDNLRTISLHEIGHYWLDYINKPMGWNGDFGHYPYNLDLFSGDSSFVDPMAYYQWIDSNDQYKCVNGNLTSHKFSKLSLYLMGFIPAESVPPIYLQQLKDKPNDDYYNTWGPNCDQPADFLSTNTITIQDVVKKVGDRVPTVSDSQKNFKVGFVILAPKGQSVPPNFIEYVKKYQSALPGDWNQATEGLSTISY